MFEEYLYKKELEGITTLGLVDKKTTSMNMWDAFWNLKGNRFLHFITNKDIKKLAIEDNYKTVDERLLPLIGVYELPIISQPYWIDDFISLFIQYATIENLLIEKRYKPVNTTAKCNEFYDMLSDLTTALKNANYADGTVKDKNGRNMKIIKYIKQQLNKFVVIPDTDIEKEKFTRHYMKFKEAKKGMYLVITNSIASIMGMSSYAPDADNDRRKIWTSCMSAAADGGLSCSVIANIYDQNSLICYVTDGISSYNMMFPDNKQFMHQQMMTRTMLRLLTDNKGKNPTIMLDRGYPNSMYTEATYNVLADIIQGTDLRLGMYSLYNSNRDGKDYFASVKNNLTKGCKLETLIHAHPMTTVMSVNCSTNCNGCMFKTNAKKCVACLSASTCSKQISCKECDAFQRGKAVSGSGYYDDQGGSRANPLGDSSAMQNAYEVYVNIEKNIQLLTKKTINE